MGKSLGVKRYGNHLAFAAGTGAITFMDLSAYVARFVMGELDEKEEFDVVIFCEPTVVDYMTKGTNG